MQEERFTSRRPVSSGTAHPRTWKSLYIVLQAIKFKDKMTEERKQKVSDVRVSQISSAVYTVWCKTKHKRRKHSLSQKGVEVVFVCNVKPVYNGVPTCTAHILVSDRFLSGTGLAPVGLDKEKWTYLKYRYVFTHTSLRFSLVWNFRLV